MANNDLQLEYGVRFDVKTGGANATAEIEALSKSWQALLDKQKLVIKMGAEAEKYSMGNTTEAKAQSSAAESDRNKQAKQLKELSAYYKELSDRARDFYNANQSDKNAALDGMKKRLEQIKKEMADIEYNLIGITDKKKPRADTTVQLNWIEDLKKEAAGIQAAMASLSNLNMGGAPANVQKLNSELTTTNFTLLQMREYYKQVEAENAKLAKNALSKTNTKDVLGMKEGSIDEIEKKIQRLNQSMQIFSNTASKVGMNDEKLNGAFRTANEELNRLTQKLATLRSGLGNRSLDSLLQINPKSIQEANALMAELARRRDALNRTDPGYANSISSINKKQAELSAENARALGISEQKTKAINNETAAFDKQSTVISNLRNMAATYISLYEAGRLVKSIAEVTGQFELQEKSLAAIIQSADKANELFGQVKNLAVISPFKFSELLSYTKQLAAYRVETDQLYDTMKNLADVSAGLGVDMSRIILAYGQVRAASVLRGQELRQFTEAGIPLVALLADKFTELEGRVVSTGEVFGKISERMVSFEMVKDIFADMSGEGGMFYNMQEIQADTLAGKISNLTDAYQIMFASIGGDGAVNDVLKGSIDLVTRLARNWRDVAAVVLPIAGGLALYKLALLAVSGVQAAQAGIYAKNIAAQQISIIQNDKEAASLARKTAFQEASLVANKARIADETIMAMLSARGIAMDKQKIVSETIRLAILRAGTDATKVANLQAEISALLTAQGIAKDRAAALARIGLAVATNTATAANVTFMSTLKAMFALTPGGAWLLIVSIIGAIGLAAWNARKEAKALNEELTKLSSAGINEAAQLSGRFKTLSETARDSTKSLKEQNDALSTLKQIYGDILPDYMLTIEGLIEIGNNYDKVTSAIYANIEAKTKEKKLNAITDNYTEKINPVVDGLKRDLGDLGVDAMLASKAVAELQKRMVAGSTTQKSAYLELFSILKEINGTEIKWDDSFKSDKNLSELKGGANDLALQIYKQKKAIEDLNQTPTTFYGNFAAEASKIEDKVKKATENIIKGQKVEGGKTVYFDESIYQFNQRKADAEREKLVEHIRKTTGLAFETVQAELAKNGGKDLNLNFGVVNWLESAVSRVSAIDTTPVAKKVNDILESVAKSQGIDASQYDKYAYKAQGADGEDSFKQLIASHQQLQEKIAQTKRANSEWATDIKVKSAVAASGYREITKAEYLNGYTNGDKRVKGLNQELEAVERVMAAFGLIDKKDKENKGATVVNPRIAAIEAEIALVEQAKKKYEELVKAGKSPEQSKTIVNDLYKDQFKLKNEKGEILFKPVFDEKGLIGSLKTAKTEFQKISKTEKQVFSVGLKINESEIKIFTDEMKAALSAIEKEFATNKKRIDLFDTIFDVTGDFGIASKIAESINGAGTTDIEVALSNAFKKSMEAIEIDTKPLFDKNGNIDIQAAQAVVDKMPDSDPKKEAQKQLDIVKEFKSKEYIELLKGLEDFKTYEKKRADIISDGLRERNKILADNTLTPEEQDKLVAQSVKKQASSLSKNSMEQFKGSETWASAFGDMDLVSAPVLERLKEDLIKFREENKDLPITELKELTKTIEDLQKRTSNITFGEFIKAFTTDYKIPELIEKLDEAKNKVKLLQEAQNDAESAKVDAETNYTKVAKQNGGDANNPLVKAAYSAVVDASKNAAKATEDYTAAVKDAEVSEKDLTTAQNARIKATKAAITANQGNIEGFTLIKSAVESSVSAFYAMADAIGITINPETKAILDGLTKGLTAIIAVLGAVAVYLEIVAFAATQAGIAFFAMMAPFWPIIAALALITAGFAIFKAIKLNGINDQLDEQKKIVEGLQEQYAELERKMGDALGTDWLTKYNQQLVNTQKQIESLGKQIELEKSKGKDASPEDLKSFEDALAAQRIIAEEQSSKLQNFVSGTDLASAASDFATAWLDAYKSFGNTSEAMKDKFKDMINSMVVNTLLAKAMEIALRPVFTAMENASKTDSAGGAAFTSEEIAGIVAETTKSTANADANLTLLMDGLKQAGVDVRDSSTNLTGLSKGISGITENTALLLGGYLDSIRFRIFAYFDAMAAMPTFDMKSSMATLMTAQNTQISHLEGIKSNTLRSAIASENLSAKIDSVIAVSTAGNGYAIKVNA